MTYATHRILRVGLCLGLLAAAPGWLAAQPAASAPVGDGLLGTYYQGRNFEQFRLRQVEATIDFHRRRQPPATGVPAEDFSARWTGWLCVPTSGHYVLHLDVDDGARLWLDGRLLLDEWRGQSISSYSLNLDLQAGRAYALRLDYCQYGADSYAQLAWVRPEQLAQFQRTASWHTLWGVFADRPLQTVIPTRYLFSYNPTRPPAPTPTIPLVQRPQSPALRLVPHRLPPHRSLPPAQRLQAMPPRPAFAAATPRLVKPADARLAEQLGKGKALVWPSLYFAQGRADLLPTVQASLDTLATILRQQPELRLQVQGHTDNQGDSTLNRQLSQRRAEAVCRYLVASGVAEARLQAKGYGGSQPVADNRVAALRPRNRRVVLQPLH